MSKLEFGTDNAAFSDENDEGLSNPAEVARILRLIAEQVEFRTSAPIADVNGNAVGRWEWSL